METTSIFTPEAPEAIGPYSQAVRCGNMLFTSGMLGVDPVSGQLAAGAAAQMRQALRNVGAVLHAAGAEYSHVVKTTVFVQDLSCFQAINAEYATFFSGTFPARSCVQVARLPKDALLEIEAVAVLP